MLLAWAAVILLHARQRIEFIGFLTLAAGVRKDKTRSRRIKLRLLLDLYKRQLLAVIAPFQNGTERQFGLVLFLECE